MIQWEMELQVIQARIQDLEIYVSEKDDMIALK